MSERAQLSPLENFVLSGVAASASKIAAAPFETVKLLQQLSPTLSESEDLPIYLANPSNYTLLFLYQIIKNEGLSFLWNGTSYNILRYFPTQCLNLMFKERIKNTFRSRRNSSALTKLANNIAAGTLAGGLSLCFVYPIDTYRTLYGVNGSYKNRQKNFSLTQLYSGIVEISGN